MILCHDFCDLRRTLELQDTEFANNVESTEVFYFDTVHKVNQFCDKFDLKSLKKSLRSVILSLSTLEEYHFYGRVLDVCEYLKSLESL